MFFSRSSSGSDKYLPWKMGGLVLGIGLILLSERLRLPWLTWIAIGVLAMAFVLRFLPGGSRRPDPPDT